SCPRATLFSVTADRGADKEISGCRAWPICCNFFMKNAGFPLDTVRNEFVRYSLQSGRTDASRLFGIPFAPGSTRTRTKLIERWGVRMASFLSARFLLIVSNLCERL